MDYQNKDEFTDAIKRAKLRVENFAERMLHIGKNQTGAIFALKNFDWVDTQTLAGDRNNPIVTESTIKLSPDEAYKRMLDGGN
jgi:myosin-crossreactive antigen